MRRRDHAPPLPRRRGFALLAALWLVVGLAALAFTGQLAAREAVRVGSNRVALTRARWIAEGCLEVLRARLDEALAAGQRTGGPITGWRAVDSIAAAAAAEANDACTLTSEPTGVRLDVNTADAEQLRYLFGALRIPDGAADSLMDALLDWRDADDVARPLGAEREWYARIGRHVPRNGPIASVSELSRVRGYSRWPVLDSVLTTDPGRIDLERAPLAVLATVPGFTHETLGRIAELRARREPVRGLLELSAGLSPASRAALLARYPDAVRLTTTEPDAWIVRARASAPPTNVVAELEVRLVRAGTRAAIVRRRTRP